MPGGIRVTVRSERLATLEKRNDKKRGLIGKRQCTGWFPLEFKGDGSILAVESVRIVKIYLNAAKFELKV